MALIINTNTSSLNAQRQLMSSGATLDRSTERLSSGMRVNSAKDDAAGLAIANRMTSQVRGLDQAVRNANDGVSLIQTAEGALAETTNILQRMRELAVQSSNGIYSNSDRATLNAENKQLIAELDRIAKSTSFNGQNLLDGKLGNIKLQVGAEANQTISFKIAATDAKTLGMGSTSVDLSGDQSTLEADTTALVENSIKINGQSILGSGQTWTGGTDEFDDLIGYINENVNGITASTVATAESTDVGDGVLSGTDVFEVLVTKLDGTELTIQVGDTKSLKELADKLNDEGGGLINASIGENGRLSISGNNVTGIAVTDGATAGGTGIDTAVTAKIVLTADDGAPVKVTRGEVGTLETLAAFGFRENNKAGVIEGDTIATPTNDWAVGDVTINGVAIDPTDTDSLQGKVDAINKVATETGVTASAFTSVTLDFGGVVDTDIAAEADVLLNGVTVDLSGVGATSTVQDVVDAFNLVKDSTGVTASLLGTRVVLEGNVAAITFGDGATGTWDGLGTAGVELTTGSGTAATVATDDVANGGIKLTSATGAPIKVELGDNAVAADIGLLESNVTDSGSSGTSIASIGIDTQANAQKAIKVIDNALTTINNTRASLGAVNNRLDFTVSNLSSISEKTTAARSRIMDADFASETANLSRATVLQQAATAMLAQANQRPQNVLSLLR